MHRRLAVGDTVRCRNHENDLMGKVLLASDTDPQSVGVCFGEAEGLRMNGALAVTNMLPLIVNYERETAVDLFGNEWGIDVKPRE